MAEKFLKIPILKKNTEILRQALSYLGEKDLDPKFKFELPPGREKIIKHLGAKLSIIPIIQVLTH